MAQKTPISGLTVFISGTWTSLWYYELQDIQTSWMSNLFFQSLARAYFNAKWRSINIQLLYLNNKGKPLLSNSNKALILYTPKPLEDAFRNPGYVIVSGSVMTKFKDTNQKTKNVIGAVIDDTITTGKKPTLWKVTQHAAREFNWKPTSNSSSMAVTQPKLLVGQMQQPVKPLLVYQYKGDDCWNSEFENKFKSLLGNPETQPAARKLLQNYEKAFRQWTSEVRIDPSQAALMPKFSRSIENLGPNPGKAALNIEIKALNQDIKDSELRVLSHINNPEESKVLQQLAENKTPKKSKPATKKSKLLPPEEKKSNLDEPS
jgi:hypothetical protein